VRLAPGLGLAIARRIAAAHGGTLAIESAVGLGTTMEIPLPQRGRQAQDG
jgi:signal transduction histidine kinase